MKWQDIVKTIAPSIASALGGPLAGNAVKAVANLFLGTNSASEEELNEAIQKATPEQLIKLKELDYQFEQLQVEQFKNEYLDRDSARKITLTTSDHTQRNLSYLIICAYLGFMCVVIWDGGVTDGEREILNALVNIVFLVVGFWFGSSKGSQRKDLLSKSGELK